MNQAARRRASPPPDIILPRGGGVAPNLPIFEKKYGPEAGGGGGDRPYRRNAC